MSDENTSEVLQTHAPRESGDQREDTHSDETKHDAGGEAPPVITAAPSAAPDAPPPSSDASQAGAGSPPAVTPSGAAPGADAPTTEPIIESQPAPEGTKTGDVIDTQEKAAAALGAEGGIHPETLAEKVKAEEQAIEETVHDVIARIRARLHSMGQEVHDAFARDIEKLQKMV